MLAAEPVVFPLVRHLVVLANPNLLGAANFNPKLLLSSS
jgi:hypothetical protein